MGRFASLQPEWISLRQNFYHSHFFIFLTLKFQINLSHLIGFTFAMQD